MRHATSTTDSSRIHRERAASTTRTFSHVSGVREPVIQSLRKVKTSGGRRKTGLYLAEGPDLCARAVRYGGYVEALICVEGFAQRPEGLELASLMPEHVKLYTCSEGLLNKCLEAKPTPACVALVRRVERPWTPESHQGSAPLWLGVDHGDNADNLGMLLRSAEAAGVTEVLLSGGTVDPWGRRVVRAARGAMFGLPLALHDSTLEAVERAQQAQIQVVATSAKTTLGYHEVDYTRPTLILVGNEHHGITPDVVERADVCVKIPMLGHIHSLNIAVAASLMLFEAQRQRGWVPAGSSGTHLEGSSNSEVSHVE